MKLLSLILFLILEACLCMHASFAGNLNVSPVLLTLTHDEPIATLTLINSSDEDTTIQADVVHWSQKDGQDNLTPTSDLIISPPLFQLAAHESQLIRVAWLDSHALDTQLTYRVLLREIIPHASARKSYAQKNLWIALQISLPLFIQPQVPEIDFQWRIKRLNPKTFALNLINAGNTTLFLNQIEYLSGKKLLAHQKTFAYVLPKKNHGWLLKPQRGTVTHIRALINGEWKIKSVQVTS